MLKDKLVAWVAVDGYPGFEVQLAYLSRPEMEKIRKSVSKPVINKKTRAMTEEIDSELFTKILVEASLLDWKGFKLEYALRLLPIELPEGVEPSEVIDFTKEDALELVQGSPEFDTWLNDTIFDLDTFRN